MTIDIAGYLGEIQKVHATGQATEHAYRPALEKLFKSISPDVTVINEPKGIKVGRPDFVFLRSAGKGADITVGHAEAKDIGLGINPKGMNDFNKAQHERYVKALPNLLYTNSLDFRFYKKGELVREISIADLLMGIQPKPDQFSVLEHQLKDFCAERLQTITSAEKLAEMMAGKAILIKDILSNSLKEDKDLNNELTDQYKSFKDQLIHDLKPDDFADIYAETIAYGMFGARLHDKTINDFSRAEALDLMPRSNPFLRALFTYVAGPNLDERISRTVDELAEIFQATDLQKLFEDFGKFTQRNDPFVHFYETFLAEYNPAKRKSRGVWYTPEPVVNFIVRAVDDVLKTEFGLAEGLADTSKVTVDWDTGQTDKKGKHIVEKKTVHRVQILDPAAGTGTFLAEVIKQIAPRVKTVAEGQWSQYVEKELIPRLHGFELLMASYAMCHTKLDMMLTEMGYKPTSKTPPRLSVYLTNSLEEGERANQTLPFAQWLSNEAKEANTIKRDMPIMCVIGNPPYSGESANKGDWIMGLMEAYKREPGGKARLNERNPKWINDDYVKFIRFAEHLIAKNGEGVLGFITNHGYLDNPTFRGMRWHLLNTFDKIWVLDLHGNAKKKEVAPDGSADKNVFDIQQGVALIIAVRHKTENKDKPLAEVFHGELWGPREQKYKKLWASGRTELSLVALPKREPQFPFVQRDFGKEEAYRQGFGVQDLFEINGVGIISKRDDLCFKLSPQDAFEVAKEILILPKEIYYKKHSLPQDVRDWRYDWAVQDIKTSGPDSSNVSKVSYRLFDERYCYYTGVARGFMGWPTVRVMQHMKSQDALGLVFNRTVEGGRSFSDIFVTSGMIQHHTLSIKEVNYLAPLYVETGEAIFDQTRRVNFDPKIHKAIVAAATVASRPATRAPQHEGKLKEPDEMAIFDYIYGVLHCPAYRETYREFLKIDFPRVPYPPSPDVFWDVSGKGTQLRKLHLMDDVAIGDTPYKFVGQGDSVVGKLNYEAGVVRINSTQGFEGVPPVAWNFYIGGYQPAQKWLKDRKGRELTYEDIRHYQKIIKILCETDRVMKTIEMPL